MRYLVRVKELKLKIDYYKTLLDEIKENIRILNETKTTIVWEGQARITFNNYYDDYIKELYVMVYKITLLINFLSSYCDNYGYEYLRLRNKYRSMDEWRDEHGVS